MKEPFVLYKRCEKNGHRYRCRQYPACDCDYYDRPRLSDGTRPWVHLDETAHNKQLAYRLAQEKRRQRMMIREGLMPAPKPPAPLLSVYLKTYTATSEVAQQRTAPKLIRNLAHFLASVGDRPLDKITAAMVDRWREALLTRRSKKTGGTWSRNTVQRVYNSVKGLFSYAAEDLADFANPCDKLEDWSEDPAERRLWQPDEQWLIDELPPLYRLPLKVGFLCGCRRSEALLLTKNDLSPKGWAFAGSHPKLGWVALRRKKKRIGMVKARIPIALALVTELHAQLRSRFQHHVFGDPPPNVDAWSSLLTRHLRRLGREYGVDTSGLSMHGTRHTATTTMQDLPGVSVQTAKNMGGWTTTRMVETYSSPAEASMQVAAAGLAKNWKPTKPKGLKKQKGDPGHRSARRRAGAA